MNKHYELIRQYAQDWCETDKPYELWEVYAFDKWTPLDRHPHWNESHEYRRKNINREIIKELLTTQKYVFCEVSASADFSNSRLTAVYKVTETNNLYVATSGIMWDYARPIDLITGEVITKIPTENPDTARLDWLLHNNKCANNIYDLYNGNVDDEEPQWITSRKTIDCSMKGNSND